jgi:hypothetical protein
VVTKDVPPYALVAGTPAEVKRYRFVPKRIERLLESRWWEFAPWDLKGAPVEEFPAFLEHVADLRTRQVPTYQPERIELKTFAGGK